MNLQAYALCKKIAEAIEGVVPADFRANLEIAVDGGKVLAHNVTIQLRPPQPKDPKRM